MKVLKTFIKYSVIFFTTVLICLFALVATAKIPRDKIINSLEESAEYYKHVDGIEMINKRKQYTYIHYYADSVLLNIIYHIDTNQPLKSVMESRFYQVLKLDSNKDYIETIEEQTEANQEYMRYWHGSMSIIRPLLVWFNISQIYTINYIGISILTIWLFILLIRKYKVIVIGLCIGLVGIAAIYIPKCLEYTWTIYLMLIFSIILIKLDKRKPNWINPVLLVCGTITAFIDFLSTEILTILVPLLILVTVRYKEGRLTNLKDGLKLIFLSMITWGIGYTGMFLIKCLIASIVLNLNAIDYMKDNVMIRVGVEYYGKNTNVIRWEVIKQNIKTLYPIGNYYRYNNQFILKLPLIVLFLEFLVIDPKKIKKMWFSCLMIIIGSIPLIRYEILLGHSLDHSFMVFRDLLVTIIALVVIIANSFEARRKWINSIINKIYKKTIDKAD